MYEAKDTDRSGIRRRPKSGNPIAKYSLIKKQSFISSENTQDINFADNMS